MKVKDFIEKVTSMKDEENIKAFINQRIQTDKYVPYAEKVAICKQIADNTSHVEVGEQKVFKVNSLARRLHYAMHLIELYTDLEVGDSSTLLDNYDALAEAGLIAILLEFIPEREHAEFEIILEYAMNDLYDNEFSVSSILAGLKDAVYAMGNGLMKGIESTIQNMADEINEESQV